MGDSIFTVWKDNMRADHALTVFGQRSESKVSK